MLIKGYWRLECGHTWGWECWWMLWNPYLLEILWRMRMDHRVGWLSNMRDYLTYVTTVVVWVTIYLHVPSLAFFFSRGAWSSQSLWALVAHFNLSSVWAAFGTYVRKKTPHTPSPVTLSKMDVQSGKVPLVISCPVDSQRVVDRCVSQDESTLIQPTFSLSDVTTLTKPSSKLNFFPVTPTIQPYSPHFKPIFEPSTQCLTPILDVAQHHNQPSPNPL